MKYPLPNWLHIRTTKSVTAANNQLYSEPYDVLSNCFIDDCICVSISGVTVSFSVICPLSAPGTYLFLTASSLRPSDTTPLSILLSISDIIPRFPFAPLPPATYPIATVYNESPIVKTTVPATIGGKYFLSGFIKIPTNTATNPPIICAPNIPPIPII